MDRASIKTFDDFWPYYLAQHRRPVTRWLHFLGTGCGLALGAAAVVKRRPQLAAAAPLVAYGTAWLSHLLFEHNRPVTFDFPVWSARADGAMVRAMALGQLWSGNNPAAAAALQHPGEKNPANAAPAPRPAARRATRRAPAQQAGI